MTALRNRKNDKIKSPKGSKPSLGLEHSDLSLFRLRLSVTGAKPQYGIGVEAVHLEATVTPIMPSRWL